MTGVHPLIGGINPSAQWSYYFDPLRKGASITLTTASNNNTAAGGATTSVLGATSWSGGRHYFEVGIIGTSTGNHDLLIGLALPTTAVSGDFTVGAKGWGVLSENGNGFTWTSGATVANVGAGSYMDDQQEGPVTCIAGVAYDAEAGVLNWYKNNTLGTAYTPAGSVLVNANCFPAVTMYGNGRIVNLRLFRSEFKYSPPSGYSPWIGP